MTTTVRFLQARTFNRPDLNLGGVFLRGQEVENVEAEAAERLASAGIVEVVRPALVTTRPVIMTTREEGMQIVARHEVKTQPITYTAKHRGRGSYAIMDGDTELVEGLSKAEAREFNRMDHVDKLAWMGGKIKADADE